MRRLTVALAALVVAAGLGPGVAHGDTLEPTAWPAGVALGSAPNAIRFGGIDRYHTSLAMTYALEGTGEFPFDSPDRATDAWWGAGVCPSSVIIVAGDTPADALAAAPLSDPLNRSDEPRLTRVAAADPFFDPIGGTDRVDTDAAPIIVTTSGRSGARGLAAPARAAVTEVRSGRCTRAREAIIVGGEAAVPVEVEGELLALGYEEVFRVAGLDRYDTAARIAAALGTEPAPAGADCGDERSNDGSTRTGFYGNSVIEYRADASSCELHGRTVVLADGDTGADALAAGWWTSLWQVPVLLVRGDGSLPPSTRRALGTMSIDTIVVLGGTGRIPERVVQEAATLATAVVGRFAGTDRYDTSVVMARAFGGWYATDADDFEGDRVCVASSLGRESGWPDALAAGPLCGVLAAVSADRSNPTRVLEPVEEAGADLVSPPPSHATVPIVLVPTGAAAPTAAVSAFLAGSFPAGTGWCRGATVTGCDAPGFVAAFGGAGAVSDGVLATVSALVAGGDEDQRGADPVLEEPFRTALDLAPIYEGAVAAGTPRGCAERGGVHGARWLAVYETTDLAVQIGNVDLTTVSAYDGAESRPRCIGLGGGSTAPALVAVSTAGRPSAIHALRGESERSVSMSDRMRHSTPRDVDGAPGTSTEPGESTSWRFRDSPSGSLALRDGDDVHRVRSASASVFLTRGDGGTGVFVAELVLDLGPTDVTGTVTGEAVLVGIAWELAGRFRLPGASGGFRATLRTQGTADNADDALEWRFDAVRP